MTYLTHTQAKRVRALAHDIDESAVLHGVESGSIKARHEDAMADSLRAIAALLGLQVVQADELQLAEGERG